MQYYDRVMEFFMDLFLQARVFLLVYTKAWNQLENGYRVLVFGFDY